MSDNQKTEPRTVQNGGWLDGHPIRTASKPHRCDYGAGAEFTRDAGRCDKTIDAGADYVDGGRGARYCMEHAA